MPLWSVEAGLAWSFFGGFWIVSAGWPVALQKRGDPIPDPPPPPSHHSPNLPKSTDYITDEWTESSTQFVAIEMQTRKEANAKGVKKLYDQHRAVFDKRFFMPDTCFKDALILCIEMEKDIGFSDLRRPKAVTAFQSVTKDPKVFLFTKVRYVVEAVGAKYPLHEVLAMRLLAEAPKDMLLLHSYSKTLAYAKPTGVQSNRKRRIETIRKLQKHHPSWNGTAIASADALYMEWLWEKDPAIGRESLKWYRKFLESKPIGANMRKEAEARGKKTGRETRNIGMALGD